MTDVKHAHARIDHIETVVNGHAEQIKAINLMVRENAESLHENTRITQQVADNTAELVDLFKGAKAFRKFVLWASPLLAAILAFWTWYKG